MKGLLDECLIEGALINIGLPERLFKAGAESDNYDTRNSIKEQKKPCRN